MCSEAGGPRPHSSKQPSLWPEEDLVGRGTDGGQRPFPFPGSRHNTGSRENPTVTTMGSPAGSPRTSSLGLISK